MRAPSTLMYSCDSSSVCVLGQESCYSLEHIPLTQSTRTPLHPTNRTWGFVGVGTLEQRIREARLFFAHTCEHPPFLYISPNTRVISRRAAVPLVGSIAPKLQASLDETFTLELSEYGRGRSTQSAGIYESWTGQSRPIPILTDDCQSPRIDLKHSSDTFARTMNQQYCYLVRYRPSWCQWHCTYLFSLVDCKT